MRNAATALMEKKRRAARDKRLLEHMTIIYSFIPRPPRPGLRGSAIRMRPRADCATDSLNGR